MTREEQLEQELAQALRRIEAMRPFLCLKANCKERDCKTCKK